MWSLLRPRKRPSFRNSRRRFVPVVTELEARIALAGNVTAFVVRGDLIIHGDNAGAVLTLSQPQPGQIMIAGDKTTVNGGTDPVTLSGVTRNLRVLFGEGNDSLTFDADAPLTLSGDVSIDGGRGSNTVSVEEAGPFAATTSAAGSLNVGGDLTIRNLSGGPQVIRLQDLNVHGNVRLINLGGDTLTSISSGGGVNAIGHDLWIVNGPGQLDGVELHSLEVRGDVHVENGGGDALTTIDSFDGSNTIRGTLAVIDGPGQMDQTIVAGTNVGHGLRVAENGSDQNIILVLASQVHGSTDMRTGNGNAIVFVNGTTFGGDFQLRTGDGADTVVIGTQGIVTLARVVAQQVIIIQNGVPVVVTRLKLLPEEIRASGGPVTFRDDVHVDLGGGDDTLNLARDAFVTFHDEALLDGGDGDNTANVHLDNVTGAPRLRHFHAVRI